MLGRTPTIRRGQGVKRLHRLTLRKFMRIDTLRRFVRRFRCCKHLGHRHFGGQIIRDPQACPSLPAVAGIARRSNRHNRCAKAKPHDRTKCRRDVAKNQPWRLHLVLVCGVEFRGPMRRVAAKGRAWHQADRSWADSKFSLTDRLGFSPPRDARKQVRIWGIRSSDSLARRRQR